MSVEIIVVSLISALLGAILGSTIGPTITYLFNQRIESTRYYEKMIIQMGIFNTSLNEYLQNRTRTFLNDFFSKYIDLKCTLKILKNREYKELEIEEVLKFINTCFMDLTNDCYKTKRIEDVNQYLSNYIDRYNEINKKV